MSNVLTYTLTLNDKMSSTLQRVGMTTNQTTKDIDNLGRSTNNLNKVNLSGFFSTISKIAGVLGVGAMIGKSIKSGMEQEISNTSFEVLFGGAENAKKMIDDIAGYAKKAYGKSTLSEASKTMAGFGLEQERIMPNLRAIGDIAMGNKERFNSLTLAFSQMAATGKLMGQDLLQMVNAGFNPLQQISKTTGKSMAKLKDEMSKGAISSNMVEKAFQDATKEGGLYYGMIDKISNTGSGQWTKTMSNMGEIMLGLYSNVIQPILLPALKTVNAFFEKNGNKLFDFFSSISTIISGMFSQIRQSSSSVMAVISPLINVVKDVFYTFQELFNIIQTGNIGEYFQSFSDLLSNYIVPLISQLWNFIKDIVVKVVDFVSKSTLLRDIWIGIMEFAKSLVTVVSWVIDKLKWLFDNVVMPILNAIEKAYRLINGYTDSEKKVVIKNPAQSITPAIIPGTTIPTTTNNTSGTSTGNGNNAGKDTANSIATGGTKTTHITINLGELVGTISINKNGFRESAENMRDIVLDEMTRVLSMAQGQV